MDQDRDVGGRSSEIEGVVQKTVLRGGYQHER